MDALTYLRDSEIRPSSVLEVVALPYRLAVFLRHQAHHSGAGTSHMAAMYEESSQRALLSSRGFAEVFGERSCEVYFAENSKSFAIWDATVLIGFTAFQLLLAAFDIGLSCISR